MVKLNFSYVSLCAYLLIVYMLYMLWGETNYCACASKCYSSEHSVIALNMFVPFIAVHVGRVSVSPKPPSL